MINNTYFVTCSVCFLPGMIVLLKIRRLSHEPGSWSYNYLEYSIVINQVNIASHNFGARVEHSTLLSFFIVSLPLHDCTNK